MKKIKDWDKFWKEWDKFTLEIAQEDEQQELHPVRFTPEQVDFIQENLIELSNEYAHVQEIVDGAIDIEETIVKAEHGIKE